MGGLILLIISTFLKLVLAPILYTFGAICSLFTGEFNQWNKDLAIAKDQYGNTLGKYFFNCTLITNLSKHAFGNNDETISSVIGKNKKDNTLTLFGKFLDNLLNIFDEDHSIESIDETEN